MMQKDPLVLTKKLKGEDGHRTLSVRIREDLYMQLEAISEETGRSKNELVITFIQYALKNCIIEGSSQKTD